ncbi:MAG: hypothetical protein Q7T01_02290 [bacterium]|nr:hypothetical protein [bacterium]
MPFIAVRNWPEKHFPPEKQRLLLMALRDAVLAAEVPDITEPRHVTVTLGSPAADIPDNNVVGIIVDFLFERTDRTNAVRGRLADHLYQAARSRIPREYRVEVMVCLFNTMTGAYQAD